MDNLPNVLVIVSDSLRRDHLSGFSQTSVHAPHLDKFARESVTFDWHLAGSFPTVPARADILTGRLACTFMGWEPLSEDFPTLPELLAQRGYLTTGIADTPFLLRDGYAYDRGFDDFIWIRGQGDSNLRPAERRDARATWRTEADRFAPRTMRAAEEWLERHYKERFFLYVDTWDPHEPWDPPPFYTQLYRPGYEGEATEPPYTARVDGKWGDSTEEDLAIAHAAYCGEITMVDRWVGRLLEKVDLLGLREKTIVVFLSDHGFYFGEHDYFGKAIYLMDRATERTVLEGAEMPSWFTSTAEGQSLMTLEWSPLYAELTRIPLIVRVPGLQSGRRSALTTAVDILPTILDLIAAEIPGDIAGRSFKEVLLSGSGPQRPFVITSWPMYFASGQYTTAIDARPRQIARCMPLTVTTGRQSLIVGSGEDPVELYDLTRDEKELNNIVGEHREEASSLLEAAIAYLEDLGTTERTLIPRRGALSGLTAVEF